MTSPSASRPPGPQSRYVVRDLGIAVLVCDGTDDHVIGITFDQVAQLADLDSDVERDVLFSTWKAEALATSQRQRAQTSTEPTTGSTP